MGAFFNASGVSCRARAEEVGPTPFPATRPCSWFPRCSRTRRCRYAVALRFRRRVYHRSLALVKLAVSVGAQTLVETPGCLPSNRAARVLRLWRSFEVRNCQDRQSRSKDSEHHHCRLGANLTVQQANTGWSDQTARHDLKRLKDIVIAPWPVPYRRILRAKSVAVGGSSKMEKAPC
jgi:hypothetical protein